VRRLKNRRIRRAGKIEFDGDSGTLIDSPVNGCAVSKGQRSPTTLFALDALKRQQILDIPNLNVAGA
jgi:hypothetical protein